MEPAYNFWLGGFSNGSIGGALDEASAPFGFCANERATLTTNYSRAFSHNAGQSQRSIFRASVARSIETLGVVSFTIS